MKVQPEHRAYARFTFAVEGFGRIDVTVYPQLQQVRVETEQFEDFVVQDEEGRLPSFAFAQRMANLALDHWAKEGKEQVVIDLSNVDVTPLLDALKKANEAIKQRGQR